MSDEHLAGELILAACGYLEVDLEEGIGVAVEYRGHAVLVHQVDVLKPVDVLAGGGGVQIDVLNQGPVELIGERAAGQLLCVDADPGGEPANAVSGRLTIGGQARNLLSHCDLRQRRCPRSSPAAP